MELTPRQLAVLKKEGFTHEAVASLVADEASDILKARAGKILKKQARAETREAKAQDKLLDAPVSMRQFGDVMKNLEANMNRLIYAYEALLRNKILTAEDIDRSIDIISARESVGLCDRCIRSGQKPPPADHCLGVKAIMAKDAWPKLNLGSLAKNVVRCTGYKPKE